MLRRLPLILIALVAALLFAACSSDDARATTWTPGLRPLANDRELRIDVAVGPCDSFNRLDVDESDSAVTMKAFVNWQVKAYCDGMIGTERKTVTLDAPLGDRLLRGCYPPDNVYRLPGGAPNDDCPRQPTSYRSILQKVKH